MTYQKNTDMDFIFADETTLVVFDPDNNCTYFFDETGVDILNALDDPCDLETLLDRLCNIYDAKPKELRDDVKEFIEYVVQKKVVEIQ